MTHGVSVACLFIFLSLVLAFDRGVAQGKAFRESELRAAVIVGILRYTKWADPLGDTINICGYGYPSSLEHLTGLSSRAIVRDKSIQVNDLSKENAHNRQCDVMLVGKSDKVSIAEISRYKNLLIICEDCNEAHDLAAIHISKSAGRIVFGVDLEQAKKNQLAFGSALLELAVNVEGTP